MDTREEVVRVRKLSDQGLLAGLRGVLGSSRKLVALLVMHLGEVEERRLHLLAANGSLFAYCTERLGMSEDEAYRRIEVARLARHCPLLLERLASGQISLSVAVLLKPHLKQVDHVALLDAVTGLTIKQAREVLAAWFPRPDVSPSIRKLPRQRVTAAGSDRNALLRLDVPSGERGGSDDMEKMGSASAPAGGTASAGGPRAPRVDVQRAGPHVATPVEGIDAAGSAASGRMTDERTSAVGRDTNSTHSQVASQPGEQLDAHGRADADVAASGSPFGDKEPDVRRVADRPAPLAHPLLPIRTNRTSSKIEPLSPERYKVVFTADADLKRKLDLARDLLRHAVPQGDLATLIGRALDLLLEKTLQRRFAKSSGRRSHSPARAAGIPSTAPSTVERIDPERIDPERIDSERIDSERIDSERIDPERIDSPDIVPAMSATGASTGGGANSPVPSMESDDASAKPAHLGDAPARTTANDASRAMRPRPTTADADDAPCPPSATPQPAPQPLPQPPPSRHLPNATRRAVLERDGLRCSWISPDGVRCESCAWLEHDHVVPRSFGGGDEPFNVRILCRAHNRLAAEQAYGQPAIARIITRRRARQGPGHIADVNAGRKRA